MDADKTTKTKSMASWQEIIGTSNQDVKSIFGISNFLQAAVEDKLDLLMVALMKLHTIFDDNWKSVDRELHDEKEGLVHKLHRCSDEEAITVNKISILVDEMEKEEEKPDVQIDNSRTTEYEELIFSVHGDVRFLNGVVDKEITRLRNEVIDQHK